MQERREKKPLFRRKLKSIPRKEELIFPTRNRIFKHAGLHSKDKISGLFKTTLKEVTDRPKFVPISTTTKFFGRFLKIKKSFSCTLPNKTDIRTSIYLINGNIKFK